MDFCVVNYFANTEFFKELKPSHYVLIDPVFWNNQINENIKKLLQRLAIAAPSNPNLGMRNNPIKIFAINPDKLIQMK